MLINFTGSVDTRNRESEGSRGLLCLLGAWKQRARELPRHPLSGKARDLLRGGHDILIQSWDMFRSQKYPIVMVSFSRFEIVNLAGTRRTSPTSSQPPPPQCSLPKRPVQDGKISSSRRFRGWRWLPLSKSSASLCPRLHVFMLSSIHGNTVPIQLTISFWMVA